MTTQITQKAIQHQDLPGWMRKAMRRNDYGVWLVLIFCTLVSWYFVVGPNLPANTATENHVYRTATYADALREGRLYPRWDAYANGGYGAPIPHYTAPGAAYLGALIEVMLTNDTVLAVRIVYLLATVTAGLGTYGLVLRLRGGGAATVAALLTVTSPYLGLTSPHVLGDLPGTLALGLAPALLWGVHRLMTIGASGDYFITTLLMASSALVSPQITGVTVGLAVGLCYWLERAEGHSRTRQVWRSLANGAVLSAFYWGPALGELHAVRWATQTATSRPVHLTWQGLARPAGQIDPLALIPDVPLTLGPLSLVAALALFGVVTVQRRISAEALALATAGGLIVAAVTLFPTQTWLLGMASLCIAVASSAALQLRATLSERQQRWVLVGTLLVILAAGHPAWLPPAPGRIITDTDAAAQITYEQQGYGVATVAAGQAYPTTLSESLAPGRGLINGYLLGAVSRFTPGELPPELQVSVLREATHHSRYQVASTRPATLPLLRAYFPGWQASLGGRSIGLGMDENGLINIDLPPTGSQVLQARLGTTPLRQVGWWGSAFGLFALAWFSIRTGPTSDDAYRDVELLTLAETRLIGVVALLSALVIFFIASPNAPYSVRKAPGIDLSLKTNVNNRTTVGLNLLAYDLPKAQYRPGETLYLTLYWSALLPIEETYRVRITLADDETRLSKVDLRHPGGYPTPRWPTGRYVADGHYIQIPPGTPSGEYTLLVSLAPCDGATPCSSATPVFFNRDGQVMGSEPALPITIRIHDR